MFGILVSTSNLDSQAYKEIIEDEHPIMVIAGKDITTILRRNGINTVAKTEAWLEQY